MHLIRLKRQDITLDLLPSDELALHYVKACATASLFKVVTRGFFIISTISDEHENTSCDFTDDDIGPPDRMRAESFDIPFMSDGCIKDEMDILMGK